jgi:hypothetical protein
MGRHEFIEETAGSGGEDRIPTSAMNMMDVVVTPRMALATSDIPGETIEAAQVSPIETPAPDGAKIEMGSVDSPPVVDMDAAESLAVQHPSTPAADKPSAETPVASASPRVNRFTLLAASLALAAALGGMTGALVAYVLLQRDQGPLPAGVTSSIEEIQALKENVVQARVELAALKVALDAGNRSASAQFTRIGERIERIDRNHAEPLTKLNRAIETLERMARGDITGAVGVPNQSAKSNVIEGWLVRDVHRGTALIEGRTGLFEVEAGDTAPGIGRVESIRKQDGRWIVVTSKGTIVSAR